MAIYADKKDGKPTGRWRVEVQQEGQRKRGRFDSITEAQDAEKAWKVELAGGVPVAGATIRTDSRAAPRTLSELVTRAAPMLWNGSQHGDTAQVRIGKLIAWLGDIRLDRLDTGYTDRVVLKLRAKGKSPGTINRYLSALRRVLEWGTKSGRGYLAQLPEFSWQDEDEGRIRWLTVEEEQRLDATLRALGHDEIADFVIAAIDTGCRRSELLDAKPGQVDKRWLRLWETKNGTPRSVPLSARAQQILANRLPWSFTAAQLRYAWDKAKTAMGLSADDEFCLHALRHTRATRLVEMGVNLRIIQTYMGHRAIATTLRYTHISDQMLADTATQIDAWNTRHFTANGPLIEGELVEEIHLLTGSGGRKEGEIPHRNRPAARPAVRGAVEAVQ